MGQAQHKVSEEDGALLLASLALKSQQHSPPIRIRSSCEIWPGQAEDQGMRLGLLQFSPAATQQRHGTSFKREPGLQSIDHLGFYFPAAGGSVKMHGEKE